MSDTDRVTAFIAACTDGPQLENLLVNARREGRSDLEGPIFRRLIAIGSKHEPGSVEDDLWRTVLAFERVLKEERGKTVRLSRTRQKIARVGELQTLSDWADDSRETEGFRMLQERGLLDLVGEAIVLRHPEKFARTTVEAARLRLAQHTDDAALLWPHGRDDAAASA